MNQPEQNNVMDTLCSIQTAMQKQFDLVNMQLGSITSRIDDIESKQTSHNEPRPSTSTPKVSSSKRKRATPTSLQVVNYYFLISPIT